MKTNTARTMAAATHEGGRADAHQKPLEELTRAVSTCLLWEGTFYAKGNDIAERIAGLCAQVAPADVAALAVRARTDLKLRHVPLFLARQLARGKGRLVGDTLAAVIRRPDEMSEFLALYWKEKRQPLSAQVKRGLALAFGGFSEYQLAKWDRDGAIKLRDVLFLCHAKPKDAEQDALWKRLIAGELATPDTWEVALSGGADKREAWERLLREDKLGDMAVVMNIRNMAEATVDPALVEARLRKMIGRTKALPFRFIAAAKAAPQYAAVLSDVMVAATPVELPGDSAVLVDVSRSMDTALSARGTLSRWESAAALGVLFREASAACRVFTFSNVLVEVPNYRGLPLIEAVGRSQQHSGTHLAGALKALQGKGVKPRRLIVVTDEQAHDGIVPAWTEHAYIVNVAPDKPGLETSSGWRRINGWSERLVDWIAAEEGSTMADIGEGDDAA